MNYSKTAAFHAAGYQDIQINSSYIGGQVRHHGNLSFSRVYQAGHEIPSYQPEAAFQIFQRAIFGLDIATGKINTESTPNYSSTGSATTFQVKNVAPPSPAPTCYILDPVSTCNNETYSSVLAGTALIHNYIVIDRNTTHLFPGLTPGHNDANRTIPGRNPPDVSATPPYTGGAYNPRGGDVALVLLGLGAGLLFVTWGW